MNEIERLIETRRDLHRHPELGYQEHRTAGIVAERLRAAGYDVRTGVAETGVVATLHGSAPGRTLLLRADMDALPIQEETTHDFVSTHAGKMHACGHDAHVAIGLAVAERLARRRESWKGTVRYVFQPAEEGGGGALRMVNEGVLDGVDAAVGLHMWAGLPSGVIGVIDGPFMAGSIDFRIAIEGCGGHGAMPQETVDATLVASQVVVSLQQIVSRNVSPLDTAVVTVGALHSGTAFNVIAGRAVLDGTLRAFDSAVLDFLRKRVDEVVAGTSAAYGATYELTFGKQVYPPTVNDPAMAAVVRRAAAAVVGTERVRHDDSVRTMAAEDFSEFSTRVPGCYFFVGARDEAMGAIHPHHSPRFNICENAMSVGLDVLEASAATYLAAEV
ncbi:MAG: amidohydrolase [Gemmatimonadetes bacterium]|nr:amidohydrolase [Gemmatimonadota bacterium]